MNTNRSVSCLISFSRRNAAFTLIEMLLVVAIIGIMSSLVVAAISNAAEDSRLVIARQQQAVVQEALNAWIIRDAQTNSSGLAGTKSTYTGLGSDAAKLARISSYLDPGTYSNFATNTGIQSDAMVRLNLSLTFSAWGSNNSYPRVNMQ